MTMPDNIIGSGNGGHPKYEFEHLFINAQPKNWTNDGLPTIITQPLLDPDILDPNNPKSAHWSSYDISLTSP